ncbi:hypothetical protein LINPERPRIM_LOCUS22238 [Linum perenne]
MLLGVVSSLSLGELIQDFVEEYFPPARITAIKDSIARFSQKEGESLYDTWNRFQELFYNCPDHVFEQRQLAEIFARGLREESAKWVNSLAEGDCTMLTREAALLHFANCASKSRNGNDNLKDQEARSISKLLSRQK